MRLNRPFQADATHAQTARRHRDIQEGFAAPSRSCKSANRQLSVVLQQGLKRQIRHMFAALELRRHPARPHPHRQPLRRGAQTGQIPLPEESPTSPGESSPPAKLQNRRRSNKALSGYFRLPDRIAHHSHEPKHRISPQSKTVQFRALCRVHLESQGVRHGRLQGSATRPRSPTRKSSGPTPPRELTWQKERGTPPSSGTARLRSGSSAARSTSARTASTAIWPSAATRSPSSGKASRVTSARSPTRRTPRGDLQVFANVLKARGIASRRPRHHLHADGSRGGHRHARLRPHRRRALGHLRRIQLRQHQPTASTTAAPPPSSPPTEASGAARSCRSKQTSTPRSKATTR